MKLFSRQIALALYTFAFSPIMTVESIFSAELELIQPGTLTIAHDDSFPPFGWAEKATDGRYKESVGFEIDVIREIASSLKLKVEFKPDAWTKVLMSVKTGAADAIATIGITDERKKSYDYSDPYTEYASLLFVGASSSGTALKDLARKKVALQKNLFSIPWIRENFPTIDLIQVENAEEALHAVVTGSAEGAVADKLVGLHTINITPDIRMKVKPVGDRFAVTPVGLAVPKGRKPEFLRQFNAALREFKRRPVSAKLYQKWFGKNP